MNEFMRELEEDIRRDKAARVWKKYGSFVAGLALAAVLGTAAGVVWQNYRAGKDERLTAQLITALDTKSAAEREAALRAVVKDAGNHAQGALAALVVGAGEMQAHDAKAALATYSTVVNGGYDVALSNLGRVMATHASVAQGGKIETSSIEAGRSMPYYDMLREAEAWRLLASGEKTRAAERMSALADDVETSAAVRARAEDVSSLLTAQFAKE